MCKLRFYIPTQKAPKEPQKTSSTTNIFSPQEGDTSGVPLTITLSADYLEKCLTTALKQHPDNPNLLRTAIEFFIKIKGKSDTLDDDIDMEALKRNGIIAEYSN